MGFTEQEVWLFTFQKWLELFDHYKEHYNFKVKGYIYKTEEKTGSCPNGWLPF